MFGRNLRSIIPKIIFYFFSIKAPIVQNQPRQLEYSSGKAGASSVFHESHAAENAFNNVFGMNFWASHSLQLPAFIWYDFNRQYVPAKIQFRPRQDIHTMASDPYWRN